MSAPPLADAARRLRENPPSGFPRRVGRPRTGPGPTVNAVPTGPESPAPGTAWAQTPMRTRVNGGPGDGAGVPQTPALTPLMPRLLDVRGAAAYLGVSTWTIRDLDTAGRLPRVRLTLADRECRRVLFDVRDLDRLIEVSKDAPEAARKSAP